MSEPDLVLIAPLSIMRGTEGMESAYLAFTGPDAQLIEAEKRAAQAAGAKLRFGSFKVVATIGGTRWDSALYPQKDGSWFLPVRKAIRVAEGLAAGEAVTVTIEVCA